MPYINLSCHEAMHDKNLGIATVIRLVNGNYDCHPDALKYIDKYGHSLHRITWYMKLYTQFTGKYIEPATINFNNCPILTKYKVTCN